MPEIAEVRTVAKTLNKRLKDIKIIDIKIIYPKIIDQNINEFIEKIKNKKILNVTNFGKYLFINLSDNLTIISHLRMEGKYFIKNINDKIEKHEHIIFYLDNDITLRYHDTRKFGRMRVVNTDEVYNTKEIKKLGIEPDNNELSVEYLLDRFKNKNIPIKTLLLDQSIINGLGNIYVDEVLYLSKIHPLTLGKYLNKNDCKKIIDSCYKIITKATIEGGTTIRSYTSSLGVYGNYQTFLNVHTMKKCKKCNCEIEKIRVGGRGTYICPKEQKIKEN